MTKSPKKLPAKKKWNAKLKFTRKRLLIAGAVLIIVIGSTVTYALRRSPQHQTLTDALITQSTQPGTFVALAISNGDLSAIEGTDACVKVDSYADGYMCQLDDDHPSITFTAAATVTVDDKSYTFSSWQGCTEQDTTARSCSVAVVAGTTLPIKALYSPSEITDSKQPGGTTQAVAPYIVVTMNDQAFDSRSTPPNTAFYVPRITTGNKTADVPLGIAANGLELSRCTITDNVTLDDATFSKQQVSLPSIAKQTLKLVDGSHAIVFDCPTTSSSNVTLSITGLAADGLAKKCADYNFTDSSSTANNLDELKSAVVGSWAGCVTTPWTPSYYVNISFKADGTYTATSTESLDGIVHTPMYWGGQQTNAKSTYRLMTFASGVGTGEFVIYFSDAGTTTQDTLKYVKVMGDKLSFEFMHFSAYGPVTYKLYRQ